MELTFVDLFCGIGTIRMGMEQAGHKCVYSVEWDKHKRKIYSIIFGGEPEGADIRAVRHSGIPKADVWTLGAPCQDFSIAGKRAGMEGERSSLVLEVFRLVRETKEEDRPKYLIYENVKGMLSSNGGRDFLGILDQMASLGYDRIEYSLLNSKNFGVPQNRERVFTVGHLRTKPWSKVFPLRYSDQNTDGELKIAGTLGFISNEMRSRVYEENSICPALSTMQGGYTQPMILQKSRGFNDGGLHEIAPTLTKNSWEHNNHLVDDASGISKTIRCGGKGSPYGGKQCWDTYNIQGKIRKLTPKECWRLQGVSDEITDKVIQAGISDSQMYRGAGDACTVNVIYEIAKKLT